MKIWILGASLFLGKLSFANPPPYGEFIPIISADIIDYINKYDYEYAYNEMDFVFKYSRNNCKRVVTNAVNSIATRILTPQWRDIPVLNGSTDYACKAIHIKVITTVSRYGPWGGFPLKVAPGFKGQVFAYCEPRTLSEKQILSLARRCETQPEPICFQEPLLKRLDEVKPTKIIQDFSQACGGF